MIEGRNTVSTGITVAVEILLVALSFELLLRLSFTSSYHGCRGFVCGLSRKTKSITLEIGVGLTFQIHQTVILSTIDGSSSTLLIRLILKSIK